MPDSVESSLSHIEKELRRVIGLPAIAGGAPASSEYTLERIQSIISNWSPGGGSFDPSAIDEDLLPAEDATYNIGSGLLRWAGGFFERLDVGQSPRASGGELFNVPHQGGMLARNLADDGDSYVFSWYNNGGEWTFELGGDFDKIILGQAAAVVEAPGLVISVLSFNVGNPGEVALFLGELADGQILTRSDTSVIGANNTLATSRWATADQEVTITNLTNSIHIGAVLFEAGKRYSFRYVLHILNDGAAEGVKIALDQANGLTGSIVADVSIYDASSLVTRTRLTDESAFGTAMPAGEGLIIIEGFFDASGTGNLSLQFAQNATGASAGVHLEVGSTLIYQQAIN